MPVMLVVLLPLLEGRMAFARQEVDLLLEELIIQIVVLNLLQETNERLFEFMPSLPYVYQRLVDKYHLILSNSLTRIIPQLILRPNLLYLLRKVLTLRRGHVLHHRIPIEDPTFVGNILSIF